MRETARETAPPTRPPENHVTPGNASAAGGGKHCHDDSAFSSMQASHGGTTSREISEQTIARLSLTRLQTIDRGLDPTSRDILRFLCKFTIATTDQLRRTFYSGRPSRHAGELACWRVLHRLENQRLITRLPRQVGGLTGGSTPNLWYLTSPGLRITMKGGAQHGVQRLTRIRRNEPPALSTLRHRLTLTETYVRLRELRTAGSLDILELETEPACWRRFPGIGGTTVTLKPDGYIRTAAHDSEYESLWFVEIDMGSESLATIQRKTQVYEAYQRSGLEQIRNGVWPKTVWIAPNQKRGDRLNMLFGANGFADRHAAVILDRFLTLTLEDAASG